MTRITRTSPPDESGVILPTALMGMLVLLMLAGLFVNYAVSQQQATRAMQSFEGGLHVAESAAELAIAALADPAQPNQPLVVATGPSDDDVARQWAVDQAMGQVNASCDNFEHTAGGDGIAVVDDEGAAVYGVAFLPDCQTRTTTRVLRMSFDTRPTVPYPATVTILTGGDVRFGGNAKLEGGIHTNGNLIGGPHQASGDVTAGGICDGAHATCVPNTPVRSIPNYTARAFWEIRDEPQANPNNDPFYELCPDGTVRINSENEPCDGEVVPKPHSDWVYHDSYPAASASKPDWGPTWRWGANHGPPDATYYAYNANVVSADNSGVGTSGRYTIMAEADISRLAAGDGSHSGNIRFTGNPKFYAAWPGVGVVSDADIIIERNISAFGDTTLIFAREQFQFIQNGSSERIFFVACDASLASATYDEDAPFCEDSPSLKSANNSPIDETRVEKNTDFDAPGDGGALAPNLGVTGIADWETL